MKKIALIMMLIMSLFLISCSGSNTNEAGTNEERTVMTITPEEAKKQLNENSEIILLDVRTQLEYDAEHIEGTTLVPLDDISEKASEIIPDQEKVYYVYCRSGNRSATAAQLLVDMGYENVYDLGGIIDWPYDTVTE